MTNFHLICVKSYTNAAVTHMHSTGVTETSTVDFH